MTGLTPRNTREWMRTVERGLLAARGASRAAITVAQDRLDEYATQVNNDRNRVPAPPIELTYQTYVTLGANKRFQAGVIVDFPDVAIGNDALPMTIASYELWGRKGTDNFVRLVTSDVSSLQWFGADPGSVWDFKARAIGALTTKPGDFSAVLTVTMINDTTAPGQPSTPAATTSGKTVILRWDGKIAGGASMPLDLDYVIVAAGPASSPTTEIGRMGPGVGIFIDDGLPYNTIRYYRLRAVDTSGNLSAWSAQVTGTPVPLVDADIILSAINAATTTITNIGSDAILTGAILRSKLAGGAVDATKLDTTINDAIAKGVSAYDGQASITSDISALQSSVSGKNKIVNSLSIASGTTGYVGGDRWQQWSSLGTGGKLLASWRYNGSAWIAELIDPVYLPQVDIGAGTFGTLNGGRLEVNSVIAAALKVSDLSNFAPSQAESAADWAMTGGMTIGATSLDPSGYRFNAFENTGTAWANGPYKAVRPGDSLYATATVYRNNVGAATNVYLRYYWYDKDKVMITPYYTGTAQAASSPNGTKLELTATAPAGAAYARLSLPIEASAGAGSGTHTGFYLVDGYKQNSSVTIADGAVNAAKVVANSMTAKQLLIGDFQNFALGSDFEDPTAVPWTLAAGHTRSTTTAKSGTASLRLAPNSVAPSTLIADVRVREGEQYYVKFHAYIDASFNGTSSNSKLRIGDQNNTLLGTIPFHAITRSVWTTTPLDLTLTVPAGVTALTVTLLGDHTAGYAYLDDIQIRRVSEASLIMNLGVEKLVATNASIAQAVIDKLWADVVRSRSITTDMLFVGRGDNWIAWNVKANPTSLTPHTPLSGATHSALTDQTHSGKTSVYVNGATVTSGTYTQVYRLNSNFTADNGLANHWNVEPGDALTGEIWVRSGGSYPSGVPNVRLQLGFYDAAGVFISTLYSGNAPVLSTTWTKVLAEVTVPAGAASVAVFMQQNQPGGLRLDDPFMRPKLDASLIVDGGIYTRHLTVTEDMTVALLAAHKVKALEIDTNDLSADTGFIASMRTNILTADVVKAAQIDATLGITSKHTITGATFQTLSTANRGIKISGGNLKAYDGGGAETFSIVGSTGAVTGTGVWKTGNSGNYIEMNADAGGGLMKFWTGTGTGRGTIYARDDAGGKRMTLSYSDLDAPAYTVPLLALKDREVSLDYGSKHIRLGDNGSGSEQLLLDATGTDVLIKGGLELSDSSARVRWRYSSSNFTLGYLGQRPETNSGIADFELRAAANGVRISGTELIANPIYANTSSSAANVFVDSAGKVWRSTSASKYKADQRLLTVPDALLEVPMKDWVDKNQMALHEEMDALPRPFMETEQARFDAINLTREPGVIAEDVAAAGGEQFTIYGPDGAVEGVKYERLALAQIQVLYRRLLEAEKRIAVLEGV